MQRLTTQPESTVDDEIKPVCPHVTMTSENNKKLLKNIVLLYIIIIIIRQRNNQ